MSRYRTTLALLAAGVTVLGVGTVFAAPANAAPAKPKCDGKTATIVTTRSGTVHGTARNDVIVVNAPKVVVYAGAGNDLICMNVPGTALGGDGNDVIEGSSGGDRLSGDNGNDTINGGSGNDIVHGNSGSDKVTGGSGNDSLYGDANPDVIRGGPGNDNLQGGNGNDTIDGETGNDNIDGNADADTVRGGSGTDVLHTDSGDQTDPEDHTDKVEHDSEMSDVPADIAAALNAYIRYLYTGIVSGDITGSGKQATLPLSPTAPFSAQVRTVTWNVAVKDGRTQMRGCVDAGPDVAHSYKVRLEPREGANFGAAEAPRPPRITRGVCEDNFQPAVAPMNLTQQLNDASHYLAVAIAEKNVTGQGVTTTLPDDRTHTLPDTGMLNVFQYKVAKEDDPTQPVEAKLCISGTADGQNYFRFVGEVHGDSSTGAIFAGACMPGQGDGGQVGNHP